MPDSPGTKIERARTCAGCGTAAPSVRTLGTLAQHGWRLRVNPQKDGSVKAETWCPKCCADLFGSLPLHKR